MFVENLYQIMKIKEYILKNFWRVYMQIRIFKINLFIKKLTTKNLSAG